MTTQTFLHSNILNRHFRRYDFASVPLKQEEADRSKPEILVISTFPPRECGIATYSQDLILALENKFADSFILRICALETGRQQHQYPDQVGYILNTDSDGGYEKLIDVVNTNDHIKLVLIQHEFGLFSKSEDAFQQFLNRIHKPVVIVFHTVLPAPNDELRYRVITMADSCESIVVMTHSSSDILMSEYGIEPEKITVIPHGTHLVQHGDKEEIKSKYGVSGRKVLSTFGLLSSGKSIETTLEALPSICQLNPDVLFLVIGKTHPSVAHSEGEKYRDMLEAKVKDLHLENNVQFINKFLPLPELLDYLQLTDIYLFTSKDPNQAVSGTFAYAVSCGCPIISTPIPHALEVLSNDVGVIIDFGDSVQLSQAVNRLLQNDDLRYEISSRCLHKMASTVWENSSIAHASLFEQMDPENIKLNFSIPEIKLDYIHKMTTDFGMIQFAKFNYPDLDSGYTLDDNARALIALCMHYELTGDEEDIEYIRIYLRFIKFCFRPEGYFLNYVNDDKAFTDQNNSTNLADSNGRAIWALGFLISKAKILPEELILEADEAMTVALPAVMKIYSTRAMAFVIKGLYYKGLYKSNERDTEMLAELANRLVQMFRHETESEWQWFESYFTYANSILPEALLLAWMATGDKVYREIAVLTFGFLLDITFANNRLNVISNKNWMNKTELNSRTISGGEQPIDVGYTIMALSRFYDEIGDVSYHEKMIASFHWFTGNNHLRQIIYNPCTGGCYDGLEEANVNLNQGAESTLSYLMARLTIETYRQELQADLFETKNVSAENSVEQMA